MHFGSYLILFFSFFAFVSQDALGLDRAPVLRKLKHEYQTANEAAQSIYRSAIMLEEQGDRRAQFAHIYAITIAATVSQLKSKRFENPKWVEKLVVNYANLYRETLLLELKGRRDQLPLAWQKEFAYTDSPEWLATFDLIYGIKVHISRDLVEALYQTRTNYNDPSIRRDFFAITEILQSAMPYIWEVYRRHSNAMPIVSTFTQSTVSEWIGRLRAQVWEDASNTHSQSDAFKAQKLSELDLEASVMGRRFGLMLLLL